MGLLTNILMGVIHLVLAAIDLVFLLLLVQMLSSRWPSPGLTAFRSAGQPVVEWFTQYVDRIVKAFTRTPLSETSLLFIGMLVLSCIRIALKAVFGSAQ